MRVQTSLGSADTIRRVPFHCWLGVGDDPNGYPNFPVPVDDSGAPAADLATATKVAWDGDFGLVTGLLLQVIDADPSRVPADTTDLDRETLVDLYRIDLNAAAARLDPDIVLFPAPPLEPSPEVLP